MRKLPALALGGIAAATLAGTAIAAAASQTHVMNVALPDGSVAHVEYVGDVAPKVTVAPPRFAGADGPWTMSFPWLAGFDRMMAQMQQRSEEIMRQAEASARQPAGASPYVAAYGNLPAGGTSTTVVSVSNNGVTCTRTTEVVAQGSGKAPKVTSSASGQCGGDGAASKGPNHPA